MNNEGFGARLTRFPSRSGPAQQGDGIERQRGKIDAAIAAMKGRAAGNLALALAAEICAAQLRVIGAIAKARGAENNALRIGALARELDAQILAISARGHESQDGDR